MNVTAFLLKSPSPSATKRVTPTHIAANATAAIAHAAGAAANPPSASAAMHTHATNMIAER